MSTREWMGSAALWRRALLGAPMAGFAIALAVGLLLMPPAGARADDETTTTTDANDVSVDLASFGVSGGTPGSWVQAALARHKKFTAARVNAAQNGETPGVLWSSSTASATIDATTSTSDTSSSLSSLLSSLTGTSSSATASAKTSTSSSTSSATDDTSKFPVRLANGLLETFLSTVTLEFQSTEFIDFLKAQLEPLLFPPAEDETDDPNATGS